MTDRGEGRGLALMSPRGGATATTSLGAGPKCDDVTRQEVDSKSPPPPWSLWGPWRRGWGPGAVTSRGRSGFTGSRRGRGSPSCTGRLQALNRGDEVGFARMRKEAEPGFATRK